MNLPKEVATQNISFTILSLKVKNIEKQTINEPNSFNVMNMCLCDEQKRHTEA